MKMQYMDGNYNIHIVPKKLKTYFDKGIKNTDERQLTNCQYLDVLEALVKMDFYISRDIDLDMKNESFKGVGYFEKNRVAFFGSKYGPTKFAISYKKFRKLKIGRVGILTLNESLNRLFEGM